MVVLDFQCIPGQTFGIFIFWVALWLWRQSVSGAGATREVWTARAACLLLMLSLWLDGLLCFFCNRIMPLQPDQFNAVDAPWRLATQPLQWGLMILLAGWLLEGALANAREWWEARKAT